MSTALEGDEGSASRPDSSLPPGKTWYPLYRRLGGPQGRSGQVRKISPPPGFDPRTVQPIASRYTDWATRTHSRCLGAVKFTSKLSKAQRKDPTFHVPSVAHCHSIHCGHLISILEPQVGESGFFIYRLMHKRVALKRILKFTLKQLRHFPV